MINKVVTKSTSRYNFLSPPFGTDDTPETVCDLYFLNSYLKLTIFI